MIREVWVDNLRRERWDDTARVYTEWDAQGAQTLSRPYTAAENAAAAAAAVVAAEVANETSIRSETEANLAKLDAEIIALGNAALFTQSGTGNALKLLARTLRLVIRLLIRRFDGTT